MSVDQAICPSTTGGSAAHLGNPGANGIDMLISCEAISADYAERAYEQNNDIYRCAAGKLIRNDEYRFRARVPKQYRVCAASSWRHPHGFYFYIPGERACNSNATRRRSYISVWADFIAQDNWKLGDDLTCMNKLNVINFDLRIKWKEYAACEDRDKKSLRIDIVVRGRSDSNTDVTYRLSVFAGGSRREAVLHEFQDFIDCFSIDGVNKSTDLVEP